MYSKKVLEHFLHPRNQGVLKRPSGIGIVGNPVCGDIMKIYIKAKKNKRGKEIIEDVKFETLGCASAIATSSMITDLAKGKTLETAILKPSLITTNSKTHSTLTTIFLIQP